MSVTGSPPVLPVPHTAAGRDGLAAMLRDPARALIALDFDGTLSPIVADPAAARAHPGAVGALGRLAPLAGTLAVITGRLAWPQWSTAGLTWSPAWSCSASTAGNAGRQAP